MVLESPIEKFTVLRLPEKMLIKLIRHGESRGNVEPGIQKSIADHLIPLTERGRKQSKEVGVILGKSYLRGALIYTSPFLRAKETLRGILEGAQVNTEEVCLREDPRLREVEHGYFDVPTQHQMIKNYGHFYYRYQGGESPADCYDRVQAFSKPLFGVCKKLAQNEP